MEALYDAVYARLFAEEWFLNPKLTDDERELRAATAAHAGAAAAVRSFSFKLRDAVVVAKGQEP
jgi:hypothetical protein